MINDSFNQIEINTILRILYKVSNSITLPSFGLVNKKNISFKNDLNDIVTEIDINSEREITNNLLNEFPDANIVGEEAYHTIDFEDKIIDSELCFVIDPLDGTWNYVNSIPLFGIIISVVQNGVTTAGIIYSPIDSIALIGIKNSGAYLKVKNKKPKKLLFPDFNTDRYKGFASFSELSIGEREILFSNKNFMNIKDFECSSWHYRLLFTEGFHFNISSGDIMPWDHLAGVLICEEAGGYSSMINGDKYTPNVKKGTLLTACSEKHWTEIANIIS